MEQVKPLDAENISVLAGRIVVKLGEVEALRKAKEVADRELNGAQVALANLRIEFTKAVDGHLDMTSLKQRDTRLPAEGRSA